MNRRFFVKLRRDAKERGDSETSFQHLVAIRSPVARIAAQAMNYWKRPDGLAPNLVLRRSGPTKFSVDRYSGDVPFLTLAKRGPWDTDAIA